jgi:hypothetical protein
MSEEEHKERQAHTLDGVVRILRADDRVLGVALGGSCARNEHDAFSDIDVMCYLRDEERTGRAELYDAVGRVAPLLCRLWLYDVNALYLFENGVRLDLDFYGPSALKQHGWLNQCRILHDPDSALACIAKESRHALECAPHPPHFQAGDPTYVDWFFWMFRQVVCWTKRGAQGGDNAYDKLASAVDSLSQVRTHLLLMRQWVHGKRDYAACIDPDQTTRMAASFPRLEASEILNCASRLLDEFERVCPEYCQKAGVPYPARKVNVMRDLMAEFGAME